MGNDTGVIIACLKRDMEEHDRVMIGKIATTLSRNALEAEARTQKVVIRQVRDRFQAALRALPEGQSSKQIVKFCDQVVQQLMNQYGARQ